MTVEIELDEDEQAKLDAAARKLIRAGVLIAIPDDLVAKFGALLKAKIRQQQRPRP